MSVKEIEDAKAKLIHTIKYIEHVPNKTTITSMREKGQASTRMRMHIHKL